MKLILSLFAVLLGATSAMGQISFSGEWYRKGSGELYSKEWISPEFSRSESVNNGKTTIIIIDIKEKKAYVLMEENKTCMVMTDLDKLSVNRIVGYDVEVARHVTREFKGVEEIEGRDCHHYWVESESVLKTGVKDGAGYNEWIYEPLKSSNYNGCVAHDNTAFHMDRTVVLRNIKIGPQPKHLFEIPEGYTMTTVPAGGLLEMITGKSRQENTEKIDSTANKMKDAFNSINEKVNDPNASKEDKMKMFIEMLGGASKK